MYGVSEKESFMNRWPIVALLRGICQLEHKNTDKINTLKRLANICCYAGAELISSKSQNVNWQTQLPPMNNGKKLDLTSSEIASLDFLNLPSGYWLALSYIQTVA